MFYGFFRLSDKLKIPNMDTVKDTNYICNSYAASQSKDKDGYLGIIIDHDNTLLVSKLRVTILIFLGSSNGKCWSCA